MNDISSEFERITGLPPYRWQRRLVESGLPETLEIPTGCGKTEAVFQFESRGMQGMLKEAKPTRLEDLIALNALYRPGPMDLIPSFVARKHGREPVEYRERIRLDLLRERGILFCGRDR